MSEQQNESVPNHFGPRMQHITFVRQILPMAAALAVACAYAGTRTIDNRMFSLDLPAGWTINAAAENISSMPEGSLQAMHITPGPYMASQNITADGPDRIVGMKHVGHHVGISWMALLPPLEKARLANFQNATQGFLQSQLKGGLRALGGPAATAAFASHWTTKQVSGDIELHELVLNEDPSSCVITRIYIKASAMLTFNMHEETNCESLLPVADQITSTIRWN